MEGIVWYLVVYSVCVTLLLVVCTMQTILLCCGTCVTTLRGAACFVRGCCDHTVAVVAHARRRHPTSVEHESSANHTPLVGATHSNS